MSRNLSNIRNLVRRFVGASGVAVLGLAWVASPALADPPRDQEERGVYGELTALRDRASHLGFGLASSTAGGGRTGLEFGRSAELRYQVGWLLPGKKGAVVITDWIYDESQETTNSQPSATLIPTTLLASRSPRNRVQADAHVQAQSLDVAYSRDFKQSYQLRASWNLGLRYFHYEHRLEAGYFTTGGLPVDEAIEEVESTGVGPRVGASFQYSFTPRWSLVGALGVATLFGDTDHGNVSLTDIGLPAFLLSFTEQRDQRRTFSQVDLDLHVVFLAWRTLQVSGGYRISEWYDARTRALFSSRFEVERVTFDGPYLSVGYRF